jgi:diguanylate cyclase (GGDEF)-like protein
MIGALGAFHTVSGKVATLGNCPYRVLYRVVMDLSDRPTGTPVARRVRNLVERRTAAQARQPVGGSHWPMTTAIVATSLICLTLLTSLIARQANASSERAAQVNSQVLRATSLLLIEVATAESSQRGYLLTGRSSYLAPYYGARADVPRQLLHIDALAGRSDPALVLHLGRAVDAKLAELERTITLRRQGKAAQALAVVLSDQGQILMAQLTADARAIESAARRRLDVRDAVSRRTRMIATIAIGVGAVLAVGFLALLLGLLRQRGHLTVARLQAEEERARLVEELSVLATHDALTGLPNRRLIVDRLQQALHQRTHARIAVMFIDLDRFKEVNDRHGHQLGDDVLIAASHRMRQALRPADTLGRVGGDEFIAVCEGLHNEEEGLQIADRLRAAATIAVGPGPEDTVSASVGVVYTEPVGLMSAAEPGDRSVLSAEQLLSAADSAMYQAKAQGRCRVALFDVGSHSGRPAATGPSART